MTRAGGGMPASRVRPVPRVLVMAKHPTPGRVKTRLAARIGGEAAAALQVAFLRDLATRLASRGLPVTWAVTPPDAPFADVVPRAHTIPQVDGDLGARMRHAMGALFDRAPGAVVTIGADAPHLDPGRVAEADAALAAGAGCVLGPAFDGGYYLIALDAPAPALFLDVSWGSSRVLEETRARAAAVGLAVQLLPAEFDVDCWDDLVALRALVAAGRVTLPATAEALAAVPDLR